MGSPVTAWSRARSRRTSKEPRRPIFKPSVGSPDSRVFWERQHLDGARVVFARSGRRIPGAYREKLDALDCRVPRTEVAPATFVRHFEDAARIIAGERGLPRLEGYDGPRALAEEMLAERQLAALPSAADEAPSAVAVLGWRIGRDHADTARRPVLKHGIHGTPWTHAREGMAARAALRFQRDGGATTSELPRLFRHYQFSTSSQPCSPGTALSR